MVAQAYVVSDLHLGAGPGKPLEDFEQDAAFERFVSRIAAEDTTLVINGDFVDFAQIPPFAVPATHYLLWSEKASLQKLETALAGHSQSFAALRAFLRRGGELRIIAGNHDFDFAWDAVQARLREELENPDADQLAFAVGSYAYHNVFIEHGYQFTPENCPREPENFIHEEGGERYLERVWGTDFMLGFYNDLERRHEYADKVKPTLSAVYYALKHRWIGAAELLRLLRFLKRRGVPWDAISGAVLASPDPVRPQQIPASFEEEAWKALALELVGDEEASSDLGRGIEALSDFERHLIAEPERVTTGLSPELAADEQAATLNLFREDREVRAARERLGRPGVTHVVFGHTHVVVDGGLEGRLFNPGTWIPHLDLKSPHVVEKINREGLTLEMLKDKSLFKTERRAVHIQADPPYEAKVRLVECL